jgi:hypothetical protein
VVPNVQAESRSTPRSGLSRAANNSIPKRGPTKRRIALVVVLAALVILSLFIVTAGNILVAGKTPLWVYHTGGTINSVSISENGSYIAVGVGFNLSSGAVLLFDRAGNLLWEHQTDRIIGGVTISANGSRIEANGYLILPGPAGEYANAEVYAFDSNGSLLWNRTAGFPSSGAMSADGSKVAVVGSDSVALLTWEGQVLWNYSAPAGSSSSEGSSAITLSQNGSRVAVGTNEVTMLGSSGNSIWTYGGLFLVSGNDVALTPDESLVAVGNSHTGVNGSVLLLTGQGALLWEHHVDSAVLSAALLPNGSSIGYVTNWNALFYDSAGTLLANYTTDGESSLLPTANGLFLLGGGGGSGLVLFNPVGRLLWSYPLNSVQTEAVSSDGAFAAASSGLVGQGGQGHPSTLYFFSTTGNGSFLQGLEDGLLNYSQAPFFILFEIGTVITIAALLAELAVMFARGSRSSRLQQTLLQP